MQSLINRNRVVLMHLSFWCVYLSFFIYQVSGFQRGQEIDWLRVVTVVSIQLSFAMLLGYLNYFYFLPRFLVDKNILQYFLSFAATFAIVITVRIFFERYFIDGFKHQEH